ncbi:MAG: hypothetical protein ACE5IK_00825 [Acidobacteriota bacterium]
MAQTSTIRTMGDEQWVLFIAADGPAGSAGPTTASTVSSDCLSLDVADALALLRAEPLSVRAIVVSGDGESARTHALLADVKSLAPRLPIVFLDARESAVSEVTIRRTGVHYYTHAAASTSEISAVLHALATE